MTCCRHCHKNKARADRRGFCWACSRKPAVRQQYPETSKYGRRGVGIRAKGRPACQPTTALPGTEAKVADLAARAAAGQHLFCDADARRDCA